LRPDQSERVGQGANDFANILGGGWLPGRLEPNLTAGVGIAIPLAVWSML
jgi:hypothetical protein